MKHIACLSSLAAAVYLGIPATGFSNDHHDNHGNSHDNHGGDHGNWHGGHGNWHGGYYSGSRYYRSYRPYYPYSYYPYVSAYPYYSAPYYGNSDYDAYDDSPSFGVSISPSATYRGARVDDRADGLTIDVQRALRRDGYYRGTIDGDIGAGTRAAIRQYQYDHRLEVTGRVDRALLRSLDLD